MLKLGAQVDDEELDGPPSPEEADPNRGVRRLIYGVLVLSLLDFTEANDPQAFSSAKHFLFPEHSDRQEYLRQLLECAAIDPAWFRDRCERLRLTARPPEGPAGKKRCLRKYSRVQEIAL